MKNIIFVLVGMLLCGSVQAQLGGQYSQYLQNRYIINPAAAGLEDYHDITLSYRKQWSGVKHSPQSYYISANTMLNKKPNYASSALRMSNSQEYVSIKKRKKEASFKHGIGAYILKNEFGAFENQEAAISYSVHVPVSKYITFSMGMGAGIRSLQFNQQRVNMLEEGDQMYESFIMGETTKNDLGLNAGLMLYSTDFFLGASAYNMLEGKLEFAENSDARTEMTQYLLAGYRFGLNNDFIMTPSILIKNYDNNPLALDVNVKLSYQERFWGGISYRNQDAMVGLLGVNITDFLKLGYAYDYTLSKLQDVASGSHEIAIGIMLY